MSPKITDDIPYAEAVEALASLIKSAEDALMSLDESAVTQRGEDGRWSPQERLGHLMDFAANFHQQVVRAMLADILAFPDFDAGEWVRAQNYQDASWKEVRIMWTRLNHHVLRLLENFPEEKYSMPCLIGNKKPVTFEKLANLYLRHLRRHLRIIVGEETV